VGVGSTGQYVVYKLIVSVVTDPYGQFATVDHTDSGNMIKLTKDESGQHHWIPMSWVTRVDQHVHVDRPGKQAMQEWSTSNPRA